MASKALILSDNDEVALSGIDHIRRNLSGYPQINGVNCIGPLIHLVKGVTTIRVKISELYKVLFGSNSLL
jgi:hypothetical protein